MRLLLVEDHADLREMTRAYLVDRGFVVDTAADAAGAREALACFRYDAMLLDIGLPDGCGLELLADARARVAGDLPTLLVTARDTQEDRVLGLNGGADDYIVKPFDLGELEARLRAVLRRPGARHDPILQVGALAFDTVARTIIIDGRAEPLGRREADLLERLMRAQGRILIKDVLEDVLYAGDEAVTPNALEAVASRLRRRIVGARDVRLENRRGIGYALTADSAGQKA